MAHEKMRLITLKSIKVRCSCCGKRAIFVVSLNTKLYYSCEDGNCQLKIIKDILGMN